MWISQKEGNIIKAVKLFKIPDPREPLDNDIEKEKAAKALKLNGFCYDYDFTMTYPISKQIESKVKSTIRIKRLET
jgi:hypothetical protein